MNEDYSNLIKQLEEIYIFTNSEEVKAFLLSELNKDLIPILKEAPEYIYKIFDKVPIYLELHSDVEEDWDEIFIIIKSSLSVEETIKKGEELFNIWFKNITDVICNRLNYIVEPL